MGSEMLSAIPPELDRWNPIDPVGMLAGIPEILRRRTETLGDKPLITFLDDQMVLTYSQLLHDSLRLARGLLNEGVRPGEHIGLFLPASQSYVVSWFASLSAGLVDVPMSTELRGPLLQYALDRGDVNAVITDAEGLAA